MELGINLVFVRVALRGDCAFVVEVPAPVFCGYGLGSGEGRGGLLGVVVVPVVEGDGAALVKGEERRRVEKRGEREGVNVSSVFFDLE